MKNKEFSIKLFLALFFASVVQADWLSYINKKDISLRSFVNDCCVLPLSYSMLDAGDEHHSIGSKKRFFGIHNMQVRVPGYQPIDLVKDDVCEYPHLFTILGVVTPNCLKTNFITQRWACVKYFLPLYFGFEVQGDTLRVTSALSQYRVFAPCMASQEFSLIETFDYNDSDSKRLIEVRVNGRGVLLKNQVLEISHPGLFAMLSKFFWPLKILV